MIGVTRKTYECYGLTVASDIDLPELGKSVVGAKDIRDIVIETGIVPDPPPDAKSLRWGLWRTRRACGIDIVGVARYLAVDGRRIVVQTAPGADEREVRLYLLGTMMGAIMMQRGNLVLHGNAIRIGDSCAVVVGRSGAGKSTLAAEFSHRGLDVLSDDVVPVDEKGRALTGYPRIKLWEDAVERLDLDTGSLERVTGSFPKFHVQIDRSEFGALPVRWVYALEQHDASTLTFALVTGMRTFDLLHEHTYRHELIYDEASSWQHLQQCAALAAQARVARVLRPAATMTAAATADQILADIQLHRTRPEEPEEHHDD